MLLIDNATVAQLLDMRECLDALDVGYHDLARGDAIFRPRIDVYFPNETPDGYYRWGTMEGASRTLGVFAIRMKSDMLTWPDGKTEEWKKFLENQREQSNGAGEILHVFSSLPSFAGQSGEVELDGVPRRALKLSRVLEDYHPLAGVAEGDNFPNQGVRQCRLA